MDVCLLLGFCFARAWGFRARYVALGNWEYMIVLLELGVLGLGMLLWEIGSI